ncbi:MAG: FAD-binding protein [Opitutales bacterium]
MKKLSTIDEVTALIREGGPPVLVHGGCTKTALCHVDGEVNHVNLSGLDGIVEYEPSEYVFTARAGTTLQEINASLRQNGQFLPFDPPLVEKGSTLGGMVAAGLSGPGSVRYGGLRDFIIGVRFANGDGKVVKGGGKVVKNAAGFDFPKFLAGSLGRLGILLEITFKVFPEPEARLTLCFTSGSLLEGLEKLFKVNLSCWEPEALEMEADGRLFVRLAGDQVGLSPRAEKVLEALGNGVVMEEGDAGAYWRDITNFSWADESFSFAKVPVSARLIAKLDEALRPLGVLRRYALSGNVAWLAWPDVERVVEIDVVLRKLELSGLILMGDGDGTIIGYRRDFTIQAQIKRALDPQGRFPALP